MILSFSPNFLEAKNFFALFTLIFSTLLVSSFFYLYNTFITERVFYINFQTDKMGNKRTGKQTSPKNKFRFDPKEKQPEPVASTSGGTPNKSSLSDEDIIKDTFQPKKIHPS